MHKITLLSVGKVKTPWIKGRMTLPHELCKLVFLEQLFRAQSIMTGTGYHH